MGLIKINGIQLYVAVQGAGFPIILIHGTGGDHQAHFSNIIEPLSKHFQTIALDCRGHGQSDKPLQFTMQDHAADILGIMAFPPLAQVSRPVPSLYLTPLFNRPKPPHLLPYTGNLKVSSKPCFTKAKLSLTFACRTHTAILRCANAGQAAF